MPGRRRGDEELAKQVTLKQGLTSYAEMAETEDYNWPLSALPPAILTRFDLPDCYREIAATRSGREKFRPATAAI